MTEIVAAAKATTTPAGTQTSRHCLHHALVRSFCGSARPLHFVGIGGFTCQRHHLAATSADSKMREYLAALRSLSACSENALRLSASG